jgi:Dyp-type peroxidase family
VTPLDLDAIQGNVAHAYGRGYPAARYVLLRIRHDGGGAARRAVARWLGAVTFGGPPPEPRPAANVNVAFTYAGLRALGVPEAELRPFPPAFAQGAWRRSRDLDGRTARGGWEPGHSAAHVLLSCHARDRATCDARVAELLGDGDAFIRCADQPADVLSTGAGGADGTCAVDINREHFGFADGCSQPAIEGIHDAEDGKGSGVYARLPARPFLGRTLGQAREDLFGRYVQRRWRLIRAGEFLLGHEDESGTLPAGSASPLGPDGTFVVYRKIEQDVAQFNRHLDAEAARLRLDRPTLEARIVGRWREGTPLVVDPERDVREIASSRRLANDFDYLDDPAGARCPLGAHVRRTNPRSGLPGGGEVTMRHRIIRRGMPYGPEYPAPGPRGLIFVAYGASIEDGFERIQRAWCDDGEALGLGASPDFLLQQPHHGRGFAPMDIGLDGDGRPNRVAAPDAPFVTVRGCAYLLLPGRRACERLSRLAATL